ncbi:MAG: leucyl/phenylalanyl-tRNA--protein transferase [Alkalispirochaeta sp.]|jgi:leucyl/phenylalanyl-tRNA--protein transferase
MLYLDETQRIRFPDPEEANPWGLLATGGNLSPGVVLSAYEQGVFPWYDDEPILWFSPDPRFVLFLDDFHVGKRLRRTLNRVVEAPEWRISFDKTFDEVIDGCRRVRKLGEGTWITPEMFDAYRELHRLGYTHSVEVWKDGDLVGGLYGLSIGNFFAGESMFSRERDASKIAFVALVGYFDTVGVPMIDCQTYTDHLASFGATEISRQEFLARIAPLQRETALFRDWTTFDGREMLLSGLSRAERNRERGFQ